MSEKIASEKALGIIAKIKAKQWKEMGKTVTQMREFTEAGGITGLVDSIKEAVDLKINDLFSPLKNELTTLINTALAPFLDQLNVIVNDLTAFIGEGAEGALIGGVVGSIASLFLPGGIILTLIGAIIGSAIEQWWKDQGEKAIVEPVEKFDRKLEYVMTRWGPIPTFKDEGRKFPEGWRPFWDTMEDVGMF